MNGKIDFTYKPWEVTAMRTKTFGSTDVERNAYFFSLLSLA